MSQVLGRNITIGLFIEGEGYVPMLCAKSASIDRAWDEIEVTTRTSPNAREYRSGLSNSRLNLVGVTTTGLVTNNPLSVFYLNQLAETRSVEAYQMTFTDQSSNDIAWQFDGIITSIGITKDTLAWSQSSVGIRISGAITVTEVVEPPATLEFDIFSDYWQTSNGNSFINGASVRHSYTLTTTDTVLEVDVEGTQFDIVTGTPTVGTRECQFTAATGRIDFPSDLVFDGTQRVFVLFKRTL